MRTQKIIRIIKLSLFSLITLSQTNSTAVTIATQSTGKYSSISVWPYTIRTGFINTSVSSKTVTGTSTNFISEFNIGSYITDASANLIGKVKSISSSTSLEFEENALIEMNNSSYGIKGAGRNDQIQVKAGTTFTIDLKITCAGLNCLPFTSVNTNIIIDSPITITGLLSLSSPTTSSFYHRIKINNTTVTCNVISMGASTTGGTKYDSLILNNSSLIVNGSLNSSNNILNIIKVEGPSLLQVGGTMSNVKIINNSTSSTIKLSGNGSIPSANYQNLTLNGTSTLNVTSGATVNGTLMIENNPDLNGVSFVYSNSAILKYNTTYDRTVNSFEWPTSLDANQVIISNTGTISLNENKIINSLSIEEGSNFSTQNYTLNLTGDFSNSGTFSYTNPVISLSGGTQAYTDNTTDTVIFNTLNLSGGQKNFAQNITINGTLNLNSDADLHLAFEKTLNLDCSLNGTGSISAGACGNLSEASINFVKTGTYNPVYFHATNNLFKNININSNCNVTFASDVALYGTLALNNVNLTVQKKITFHTSYNPITSTGGKLNMESTSSLATGECSSDGIAFNITSSLFANNPLHLTNFVVDRSNGVNIVDIPITVSGVFTLTKGILTTNNLLTLRSNSSGTARIAPVVNIGVASINGKVTVERFIPGGEGKRKWRLLSAPVNNSNSIELSEFIDDIFVTAPNSSAGGFDPSPSNNSSIRTYNESNSGAANIGWQDPTNISNTISTGKGVEVFVRGSRFLANPYLNWTIPDDVTIDYSGTLNIGHVFIDLSYTNTNNAGDGFNLVGNPYASPINFDTTSLTKVNIDNKFWCYNPNTGLYGLYDADLNLGTNGISPYIASGQGFFVKANASNPGILFTENIKCVQPGNNYFKSSFGETSYLKIGIVNDSLYQDETVVVLKQECSDFSTDKYDAVKFYNDALNLFSIAKDNTSLCMDARPLTNEIDTVLLAVYSYNGTSIMNTHHQLKLNELVNAPNATDIILWDKYLNIFQNFKENTTYNFAINSDSSSWGKKRFALLFKDVSLHISAPKKNDISIYPNPSKDLINVVLLSSIKDDWITYHVYDHTGKKVQSETLQTLSKSFKVDLSQLQVGLYYLEVLSKDFRINRKIIKQ